MQTRIISNSFSLRRQWLLRAAAALLAAVLIAAIPGRAHAGVFVSVSIAPPPLPVYVQPAIPGAGYIWTPGYWAWDGYEYYWVPGTWVLAPYVGALWTPGYWGWSGGLYIFHSGYWGRHVGFYGGINYGFGYTGVGYGGGYWRGGGFYYNRAVNHVTTNITHVYNHTVVNRTTINRTSYNGGPRGITARATPQQQAWGREPHTAPVAAQLQQRTMASRMPSLRASVNHGAPPIAATPRAGAFSGRGVTPTAMTAHETRVAPRTASASQRSGALRSASFAPHANATMRTSGGNRYQPAGNGYRGTSYRPQSRQAQAYRPAPRYAQPAYRPAYRPTSARPAQYSHAAAARGRPAAAHQTRSDDQHH